ncbi:MAG: hypothetical protein ACLTSZ_03875 [Lachnospiraceae bacterium]
MIPRCICSDWLSDGGVHSHNTHIYGLLELAKRNGLKKFMYTASWTAVTHRPQSGKDYVQALMDKMRCRRSVSGEVASVMGRYYAMDRDNRWDRVGEGVYRH